MDLYFIRHLQGVFFSLQMIIVTFLLSGCFQPQPQPPPNKPTDPQILATVNGEAITQQLVDREVQVSRLNLNEPLPPLLGDDLTRAREEALNQLISRRLVLQAASQQGFVLDDTLVESHVRLWYGSHEPSRWVEVLAQVGVTHAEVRWWVREILTVERFMTEVILVEAAVDERQAVYNAWLNQRRAAAEITVYDNGGSGDSLPRVGEIAPPFSLSSLNGQPIRLSDYAGQVVLLNIWATWCSSCLTEMPAYQQVYQRHQAEFVILALNFQGDKAEVQQYAAGLGLTFPILLDPDGQVARLQYRVSGMPTSFLIDAHGRIVYQHIGPMSQATLMEQLAKLGVGGE